MPKRFLSAAAVIVLACFSVYCGHFLWKPEAKIPVDHTFIKNLVSTDAQVDLNNRVQLVNNWRKIQGTPSTATINPKMQQEAEQVAGELTYYRILENTGVKLNGVYKLWGGVFEIPITELQNDASCLIPDDFRLTLCSTLDVSEIGIAPIRSEITGEITTWIITTDDSVGHIFCEGDKLC